MPLGALQGQTKAPKNWIEYIPAYSRILSKIMENLEYLENFQNISDAVYQTSVASDQYALRSIYFGTFGGTFSSYL